MVPITEGEFLSPHLGECCCGGQDAKVLVWGLGTFWGPSVDDGVIWEGTLLVEETPSNPTVGLRGTRSQKQLTCNK